MPHKENSSNDKYLSIEQKKTHMVVVKKKELQIKHYKGNFFTDLQYFLQEIKHLIKQNKNTIEMKNNKQITSL